MEESDATSLYLSTDLLLISANTDVTHSVWAYRNRNSKFNCEQPLEVVHLLESVSTINQQSARVCPKGLPGICVARSCSCSCSWKCLPSDKVIMKSTVLSMNQNHLLPRFIIAPYCRPRNNPVITPVLVSELGLLR